MIYIRNMPVKYALRYIQGLNIPIGTVRIDEFKDNPGVLYAYLKNGRHVCLTESPEAKSDDFSEK